MGMTLQGTIQNGIVILQGGTQLPDGTSVTVVVDSVPPNTPPARNDQMSEEQRRKLLAALDAITSLPYESLGDGIGGRDHDKVLYGGP